MLTPADDLTACLRHNDFKGPHWQLISFASGICTYLLGLTHDLEQIWLS